MDALSNGWTWVRMSYRLFSKNPFGLSLMFMTMVLSLVLCVVVPLLGQIAAFILMPVFAMSMMQSCRQVDLGEACSLQNFFSVFRSASFKTLCLLGVVQTVGLICSLGLTMLVDGGALLDLFRHPEILQSKDGLPPTILMSGLMMRLFDLPFTLVLWFAPPLIAWQDMALGKAMFYSAVSVWRNRRGFFAYFLSWLAIFLGIPLLLSSIASLTGVASILTAFALPLMLMLTVLANCSFYVMYQAVFENREGPSL